VLTRKFSRLPLHMKLMHLEAFFFQLSIGLLLKIIPFRRIPGMFPNLSHVKPGTRNLKPETPYSLPRTPHLQEIKQANSSISRFSPWENKCLIKSLAARKMLNRRGMPSQLSLGVLKDTDSKTIAHAWIKSGDFEIVEKDRDYTELYNF